MIASNTVATQLSNYQGEGPYLIVKGKRLLDAASGTFNLPLGYNHPILTERLRQQLERCVHLSSAFTSDMADALLARLRPYLPEGIERFWFRDITGSGAVEGAIRMAQKATGKSGVISLFRAHHGQSLATASISGNAFRLAHFHNHIEGSLKIPAPASLTLAADEHATLTTAAFDLEPFFDFASSANIACIIVEPVQGNAGNIVLPPAFYRAVRDFADRHHIAVIADEVQTGFGRTGSFFASTGHARDLKPDILVFAKGAGGIGIPTAGILMRPQYDVLESFEHSNTSGANPLCITALDATISVIQEEGLLHNVQRLAPQLAKGLLALQQRFPELVSNARGLGFMYGFDMPNAAAASDIVALATQHGLIVRGSRYGRGNAIKIRPPLICNEGHIKELLEALEATLATYAGSTLSQEKAS